VVIEDTRVAALSKINIRPVKHPHSLLTHVIIESLLFIALLNFVIHAEHVVHRRGYCFHFGCMYLHCVSKKSM